MPKTITFQLADAGVPLDEEGRAIGYSITGTRAHGIHDWLLKKEDPRRDPEFRRLVWRLRAKKYWAEKDPELKAAIRAYRKQWAEDNRDRCNEMVAKWKREQRADPAYRETENEQRRARRAAETEQRRRSIVYTCECCGAQWSFFTGRIPSRPPKYCSRSCAARANYERGKAAGKRWAKRDKASRRDR